MKGLEYIFIGCLMLLLAACQPQDVMEESEELAELTFKIALSDSGSRGLEDGDYLDKVSVYLVNANNEIVARKENISVPDNATEVEVKFEKSDKLKRGIHTLMAVANHGTLNSFTNTDDYNALMNKQVHATTNTDNISPKNIIQPLSLMKEIELHAGHNEVEGELVRTFARLRIEVKNNSGSMPLKINSLTFSDNFSQKQAYVFDDGTDRKYTFDTGAPKSTSTHALQPFTTDDGQSYKTIEAQNSGVVFDSYLLESKVAEGEKYTYTLDLAYGATANGFIVGTELNRREEINKVASGYFLIKNLRSGKFMYCNNENKVYQGGDFSYLESQLLQGGATNYLWTLESNGNNMYYIKNVSTGYYIGNPNSSNSAVGVVQKKNVLFTFSDYANGNGVMMKYDSKYLNDYSSNFICGWYDSGDIGSTFSFYVIDSAIEYDTPITLTTIDPITQQPSSATAIKRNDFINVLITVSYNPVAGTFEFHVEDWNTGGGQVDFN